MSVCDKCDGTGHTKGDSPILKSVKGKPVTVKQGSGCKTCLGTGQAVSDAALAILAERAGVTTLEMRNRLRGV